MMKKIDLSMITPNDKGSYCLIFQLKEAKKITVGKFGTFLFHSGYYYYFGSAKGSGGLQARINRHVSNEKNKFWHIDFLRPHMIILAVVFTIEIDKECEWSQTIEEKFDLCVPVKGFGSSDCQSSCKAHLLHSETLVNFVEFSDRLEISGTDSVLLYLIDQEKDESTVKSKGKISN